MVMTVSEILADYRSAKDKKAIIEILADQNLCKPADIKKVLAENGATPAGYTQPTGKPKGHPKKNARNTPVNVCAVLRDEAARLEMEKNDIPAQIEALQLRLAELEKKINAVAAAREALAVVYGGEGQ